MKLQTLLRTLGLALLVAPLTSLAQPAAATWSVTVLQDGQALPAGPEVRLRKAPFSLQFNGPARYGYGVLAATQCDELRTLSSPARIEAAIRPDGLAAEGTPADNIFLIVNGPGLVKAGENTAHAWSEDPADDTHSFQTLQPDGAGRLTARRDIRELIVQRTALDSQDMPVARYPGSSLCLLLTGLPPVGRMTHEAPRLLSLRFD